MQDTIALDLAHYRTSDGINYGGIIRDWRKDVLGWKNADIAVSVYNDIFGESAVSIRSWLRMEQQNTVPRDKRRRFIQVLLNMPPVYLGLSELNPALTLLEGELIPHATRPIPLNIDAYEERLPSLWRSAFTRKSETHAEIAARINAIEQALLYGGYQQQAHLRRLLCQYLIAAGNLCRYQGYFYAALDYLDKAQKVAEENHYDALLTTTLYIRAFCIFNRWTNQQHAQSADLLAARQHFQIAQEALKEHKDLLHPPLICAILADGARALAYSAQDRQDRLLAQNMISLARPIVEDRQFRNTPSFLSIDQDWLRIDESEVHLACGEPGTTIELLEQTYRGDPKARQRYLYSAIIEADAYIAKGWGDVGIIYLEEALLGLNATTSRRHLSHIILIYERLKQDKKYRASPDVARLSLRLLQVQHPEFFGK